MRYQAALRVSKNTSMLFIGMLFRMLTSFAFVVYIAASLGVTGFGKYCLAFNYFELSLSLVSSGLAILITRQIATDRSMAGRYLTGSSALVVLLSLVAAGILWLLAYLFGYAADTRMAIGIASLALLPASIAAMCEAVFVAHEKTEYVTCGTVCESVLRVGLGLAALYLGFGLLGLFVALVIARVVLLLVYVAFLWRRVAHLNWRCDWTFFKRLLRDWRVFAMETSVSSLNCGMDVILLSLFFGEAAVGIYSAAAKVLRLGTVVARSFTTAIFPYLSRLHNESRAVFWQVSQDCLKYMTSIALPAIIGIVVLAQPIIDLLFPDDYAKAAAILQVLSWGLLLEFLNPFLSHILFARGEQRKSLIVAVVKLTAWCTVGVWLIKAHGPIGTAWAMVLVSAIAFCIYCMFAYTGEHLWTLTRDLSRVAVAAGCLVAMLLTLKTIATVPLLTLGIIVYVFLLLVLRVFTMHDLKRLQSLP